MKYFEKYKTSRERVDAFRKSCNPVVWNCTKVCKLGKANELGGVDPMECFSNWLDLEAESEKPMNCPFCGSQCVCVINEHENFVVRCTNCDYTYGNAMEKEETVNIHNGVCKAVDAYNEGEVNHV